MKKEDILVHLLPKEIVDHFTLQKIEEQGEQLKFYLDEKNVKPPEHADKELESKGFTNPTIIQDFPIRAKAVQLVVRRRKWKDKITAKTYTRDWELKSKGTSYSKEFAAFLKEVYRY